MDTQHALPLLGGLTPQQFMRRHWQKKPLLVRQAIAGFQPFLSTSELFELASRQEVESRLIVQKTSPKTSGAPAASKWAMKSGPFARRAIPPLKQPGWTLLVQGVDLHFAPAHELLRQFRFLPDARLDDLMVSMATPGGGVGPHFDSYDVFLFQASGSRRWRISAQKDLSLQPDVPLKILQNFQAEQEFVLHAGDMLYLPPRYAHDGVAVEAEQGEPTAPCMTYSIGFRAPHEAELVSGLLERLSEVVADEAEGLPARFYRDPGQQATDTPAKLPEGLLQFARTALERALSPELLASVLGEYLSEPKPSVWFEANEQELTWPPASGLSLHARSRMLYDQTQVFINGESFLARGADARLMHRLADQRGLSAGEWRKASPQAREVLAQWLEQGWLTVNAEE